MARQRADASGGGGQGGFFARLKRLFRRRAEAGTRPDRRQQCYQWTYRWEWVTEDGERLASGVHVTVTRSGDNYRGASAQARREMRPQREQSRPALERQHGPVRLRLTRVGSVVPVPGTC